jgi:hypothetical protein
MTKIYRDSRAVIAVVSGRHCSLCLRKPDNCSPERKFHRCNQIKKNTDAAATLLSLHHHLRSSTSPTEIPERIKVSFLQEKKGNQDQNFSNQMG